MKTYFAAWVAAGALLLPPCHAIGAVATTTYYGNLYDSGVWAPLGGGTLKLEDKGSYVNATFTKGYGGFNSSIVFYLDTGMGGFTDTSSLAASSDYLEASVSGAMGSARSVAYFADNFHAAYAIGLTAASITSKKGELYHLDGNGALSDLGSVSLTPINDENSPTYTFQFSWDSIGEGNTSSKGFRMESTWASAAFHDTQSFEQTTVPPGIYHPVAFTTYDVFGVEPVPETSNTALAIFGGLVVTAGIASRARRLLRPQPLPPGTQYGNLPVT
jgi:hypothetical protein